MPTEVNSEHCNFITAVSFHKAQLNDPSVRSEVFNADQVQSTQDHRWKKNNKVLWELGGFIPHKLPTEVIKSHWRHTIRHFRRSQLSWFHNHGKTSHLTATLIFTERAIPFSFGSMRRFLVFRQWGINPARVVRPGWCPAFKHMGIAVTLVYRERARGWPAPTSTRGTSLSAPWTRSFRGPTTRGPLPGAPHHMWPWLRCPWAGKEPGSFTIKQSLPLQIPKEDSLGCTGYRPASTRANGEMWIIWRWNNYLGFPPAGNGRG